MVELGLLKVGDALEFYCKRCRLNLNGNVASMEYGKPKTVTCRTCRSTVVYAREKTQEELRAKKMKEVMRIREKRRPQYGNMDDRSDAASSTEVTKRWRAATADVDARYAGRYDRLRTYEVDEILIHREHGLGIVTGVVHENAFIGLFRKVEVPLEMAGEPEELE
jgi:hypothetical protein